MLYKQYLKNITFFDVCLMKNCVIWAKMYTPVLNTEHYLTQIQWGRYNGAVEVHGIKNEMCKHGDSVLTCLAEVISVSSITGAGEAIDSIHTHSTVLTGGR